MRDLDLTGRRALVTGGSRGIGRAIAVALADAGAAVAIHHLGDADRDEAENTAQAIGGVSFDIDQSRDDAPQTILDAVLNQLGGIDIAVLGVAVQHNQPISKPLDIDAFDRQTRINFRANTQLMLGLAAEMRPQGWGRLLHIGSVQQDRPSPQMLTYAATKSAMLSVARNLAQSVAVDGITVNNLRPGVIQTPRNAKALDTSERVRQWTQRITVGRLGIPDDCAAAALLLCSDGGRYITGIDLRIDGGLTL